MAQLDADDLESDSQGQSISGRSMHVADKNFPVRNLEQSLGHGKQSRYSLHRTDEMGNSSSTEDSRTLFEA